MLVATSGRTDVSVGKMCFLIYGLLHSVGYFKVGRTIWIQSGIEFTDCHNCWAWRHPERAHFSCEKTGSAICTWLQTKVYLSCSSGSVVLEQLCEQRISDFLDFAILQCVVGMSKFYLIINVISFSQFFLHWHLNPVIKRALYTYFCITFSSTQVTGSASHPTSQLLRKWKKMNI